MKNLQRGFVIPLIITVIALLLISGGIYFYTNKKTINTPVQETSKTTETSATQISKTESEKVVTDTPIIKTLSTSTSSTGSEDTDISLVKDFMKEIGVGYTTGENSKIIKHATDATSALFSGGLTQSAKAFSVGKIYKSGDKIIADNTITKTNGVPESNSFVFIKEKGEWKFDLAESMKWAMSGNKNTGSGVTSNQNGNIDFIVTGIKVYPTHPIVNNEDVEIVVSVKNIGTKTSEKGVSLEGSLLEFKKSIPYSWQELAPILPGETVNWSYKPYNKNEFFKISDTAGKRTLKIDINTFKDIKESNYDNNTFTQSVEFFVK